MHLPAKSQISSDTTWSAPAITNVINALQVISENSMINKNQIRTPAANIHLQILSAFEQQEQCLKDRKELVLYQFESMIDAMDRKEDNNQQEVDQMIVDLEGYLALLQSKGEIGVDSEEKLHAWVTSTLLQASDLCQSYSNQTDCIQFEYNDLKETIANFGELKVNFPGNDAHTQGDDDGIVILGDKQWLLCSKKASAGSERFNEEFSVASTENSHTQSMNTDSVESSSWLVNSNEESTAYEVVNNTVDYNSSDWLATPSKIKTEPSPQIVEISSFTSDWLRDSSMTVMPNQQSFQAFPNQEDELNRWLSPKSKSQTLNDNEIRMSALVNDLFSVSLSDQSQWLLNKNTSNDSDDNDICQWLTGKSSNQCDSCKASCPFDSFKTDTSTNAKKKWLSTATNW